jgi:hypothetical protein
LGASSNVMMSGVMASINRAFHEINVNGRYASRELFGQARVSSYRRAGHLVGMNGSWPDRLQLSSRLRRPPRPAPIANSDRSSLHRDVKHGGRTRYERGGN